MTRAGLILIAENKIALIERHRTGQHYFVFPGGRVEENESLTEAVIREAYEELGLNVTPEKLVAVVTFCGLPQYYYQVIVNDGVFGAGKGPEMMGLYPEENGTYVAVWKSIDELRSVDLRPAPLIPFIEAGLCGYWPNEPQHIVEPDHDG